MEIKKAGIICVIILAFAWFPHSYQHNIDLGLCFPIYYEAGKGNFIGDWIYNDTIGYFFKPFAALPYSVAFGMWYALGVLVWLSFTWRWPIIGLIATYPMLLALEVGQVDPILAWFCLTPYGAVLAACVKPYLVLFIVLHAYLYKKRISKLVLQSA